VSHKPHQLLFQFEGEMREHRVADVHAMAENGLAGFHWEQRRAARSSISGAMWIRHNIPGDSMRSHRQ
jgi:hypothetical protein